MLTPASSDGDGPVCTTGPDATSGAARSTSRRKAVKACALATGFARPTRVRSKAQVASTTTGTTSHVAGATALDLDLVGHTGTITHPAAIRAVVDALLADGRVPA